MTKILGIAGRKGSGKNTIANYIIGAHMQSIGITRKFSITDEGQLWVTNLFDFPDCEGVFDVTRSNQFMDNFLEEYVRPFVKLYSFADLLKQEVCMKVLGLTWEQCYESDDDKNSLTHLLWEDMPGIIKEDQLGMGCFTDKDGYVYTDGTGVSVESIGLVKTGQMTAREVLQYVGTNIFRKMYERVWVDALIRKIKKEDSVLAIVADCRFPNEVQGIQQEGGKVIRLTRNPHPEDQHDSETALDNHEEFDFVVDNANMTIVEQCNSIYDILSPIGYIPMRPPSVPSNS